MAICMVCGAGSPAGTVRCASCGTAFGPAPAGSGSAIGEVVEEDGAEPSASTWGRGTVHRGRGEWLRLDRTLLAAPRALLLPTLLLLTLPLLLAGRGEFWHLRASSEAGADPYSTRYGSWLGFLLTAFGAAWRATSTLGTGTARFGTARELVGPSVLVSFCWLLLLWLGVRREIRVRGRGGALPTLGAAGREAAWTGLLAGLVALLLAALSTVEPVGGRLNTSDEAGAVGWQAGLLFALAAALVAFAGWGGAALRAAGQRPAVLGWLSAAAVSVRVLAVVFGLVAVVGTVGQAIRGGPWEAVLTYGASYGLFLFGLGSGARTVSSIEVIDTGRPAGSYSLFDLGGHSTALWWAVLLPLAAALLLAYGARRAAFRSRDRLKLAAVHAALTSGLILACGQWAESYGFSLGSTVTRAADRVQQYASSEGWSLATVLVAAALWTALGALGLPAVLDLVRPRPAAPAAGPGTVPVAEAAAEEERQAGAVLLDAPESEPVAAGVPAEPGTDPHAVYRRPGD